MASIRQEKVARVIKESVSDTIANHLNDPRITGLVSITEVNVSPDLRNACVSISVMSDSEKASRLTFTAIQHAARRIQALFSKKMSSKFCPHLSFQEDTKLRNTLATLQLIEDAAKEYRNKDIEQATEEPQEDQ